MRMLLAFDQSKDSKAAIQLLKKLTWPAGSTLILLHVITVDDELRQTQAIPVSKKKSGDSEKARLVDSELRRLEQQLASETLQVQSMVLNGLPGQDILNYVRKKKVDMVIVGSRGLSRIAGLLLGSVSEWILNEAPCSVLISRPTAHHAKSSSILKVLLATDGSDDSWKAVEFLKGVGLPPGSMVTLLHVVRKHLYETEQFVDRGRKSQAEFAKLAKDVCGDRSVVGVRLLKDTRKALYSLPCTIEERIALGYEAKEILKTARQQKVDVVLIGSKGMTGLRRLLMGSVAHSVSQHAPCSVLVVGDRKKS